METSDSLEVYVILKVVWKSALTMSGVPCVLMHGEQTKLKLSVDNLDSLQKVACLYIS